MFALKFAFQWALALSISVNSWAKTQVISQLRALTLRIIISKFERGSKRAVLSLNIEQANEKPMIKMKSQCAQGPKKWDNVSVSIIYRSNDSVTEVTSSVLVATQRTVD